MNENIFEATIINNNNISFHMTAKLKKIDDDKFHKKFFIDKTTDTKYYIIYNDKKYTIKNAEDITFESLFRIEELEKKIVELEYELKYRPGGSGMIDAKNHFNDVKMKLKEEKSF